MLALDIGGTLAKAAFYIPKPHLESLSADGKLEALTESSIPQLANGDKIFLKSFKSNKIEELIHYVKEHDLLEGVGDTVPDRIVVHATGGGAFKYNAQFEQEFGECLLMKKYDEMQSLVEGMHFVLNYAKEPSYTFREGEGRKPYKHVPPMQEKDETSGNQIESTQFSDSISTGGPLFHNSDKCKLLVSIGSGVSMIKVSQNGTF